jgi:transposase InsO family protein
MTGRISCFVYPQTITTDKGCQFNSQLFQSLASLCGIQLSWTTAHHPAGNGLMEHHYRTLKAVIIYHADQQWTEELPWFFSESARYSNGTYKHQQASP